MKTKNFLTKTLLLAAVMLGGSSTIWADPVTLAQWYPTSNVLYTAGTGDHSNYYTASEATYTPIQKNFSDGQPYFYPTTCNVGSLTDYTLSFWSSGSGKQWAIRSYNNSAFAFYTAPVEITKYTDYLDGSKHDNYMEVNFPATGYKNLKLSFQISGNNGKTVPLIVVVSTDGGTTWQYGGNGYTSGNSWSNFNKSDVSLAVSNCANVKVRILQGYDSGATSDWYQKEISITGEVIGEENVYTLTPGTSANGITQVLPVGGSFASSEATSITATAIPNTNYAFLKWNDETTTNPYNLSLTSNKTLTATFAAANYYTLTTSTNYPWAGTITRSVTSASYLEGSTVTLTASANEGFTFSSWSTGATTASVDVTMDENKNITANYTKNLPAVGTENAPLVSWTFNGQYDATAGEGKQYIYTPTGGNNSTISESYSSKIPVIRPDYYYYGNSSDYTMTGGCDGTWKLGEFYSGSDHYVFYIGSSTSSWSVTDYTDANSYTNYYEASFPTTFASSNLFYDNLKLTFVPCANNEDPGMEYGVVYSVDNGTTWNLITTVNAGTHWNNWPVKEVNLPSAVANKSKVIVRIIRKQSSSSADNKIDYFTVTGTVRALPVVLNENSNYTPAAVENVNVTLTRTINAGNWSTIVLPFDMTAEQVTTTFGEGTKLAAVGEYNSSTKELTTTTATTIAANIPCFIKVPSNFTSATISGVTIKTGTPEATISGDFKFAGTYEKIENLASGNYYVKNNSLFKATGTQTIKPFRAYFTGVPANARLTFLDDNTTSIANVDVNVNVNANDNLDVNAPIFNLAGQRVGKNYKGIVIQNGKKYIQK